MLGSNVLRHGSDGCVDDRHLWRIFCDVDGGHESGLQLPADRVKVSLQATVIILAVEPADLPLSDI